MKDIHVELCKLFKESYRVRIISCLLDNYELKVCDFNLDDDRLDSHAWTFSPNAIKEHLTDMRKNGFVKYRKQGRYCYWRLNVNNPVIKWLKVLNTMITIEGEEE